MVKKNKFGEKRAKIEIPDKKETDESDTDIIEDPDSPIMQNNM